MTPDQFRKIALSFAETSEGAHMGHPDFRVGGKIFATLRYPDERFGVVVLTPEDQKRFVRSHPNVFAPVTGVWGLRGNTQVNLNAADAATLRRALSVAWQRRAGKEKTRGHTSESEPEERAASRTAKRQEQSG
jgi:hypothetical protein